MGLLNNIAKATANTTFEEMEETNMKTDVTTTAAAPVATKVETVNTVAVKAPVSAPTTTFAVQAPVSTAVAVAGGNKPNALAAAMAEMAEFENSITVEYNQFSQIIATNGNFVDRETNKVLGDTVVFELLSYQNSYVVSPNDDKAPIEVLRFSADGITCSDTDKTPVKDHLIWLRENGYPQASLKERVVVVGLVESAAKTDEFNDTPVQFDLSPKSRVMWVRYLSTAAMMVSRGKLTKEGAARVKATAQLATSSNKENFTQARFETAK
jgi:hypothetical protein